VSEAALRLAINAMPLRSPLTGIGQYTLRLAQALLATGEVDAQFFYGSHWSHEVVPAHSATIDTVKQAVKRLIPYPYRVTRAAQAMTFARGVWAHRPKIYHEPNYMPLPFRGRIVATFHDLSVLHMPHVHPQDRVEHWRRNLPHARARVDHFLTDSEFVRQEMIATLNIDPTRVTAAPIGIAPEFMPRCAAKTQGILTREWQLIHGEYLLAVGTLEPRKNLATALQAYARLPDAVQSAFPFVVAGRDGWNNEALARTIELLKAKGRLRFLGFVEQANLPFLYAGARAFVYPSLYEGFGLPVAEALATGVPTLTTLSSSLPEVAGDAALLVAAQDVDAMAGELLRLLTDETLRMRLTKAGPERARQFSWAACAEATLGVYRSLV
jgi:glycosyltransferase involved in cell wall biosynthesis